MSLAATEVDPLRAPAPADWDGFGARQRLPVRWDSRLLRAASWCAQGPSSMVRVYEPSSGETVALFYARHVGLRDPRRFADPGRVPALGLTECRVTPMLDAGMAFSEQLDPTGRGEAVRSFERAVRHRAGAGWHPIAYRSVPERLLDAFPGDRRQLGQSPVMVVHNEWSDLAGYLASLPGRRGSRLEKIRAAIEADGTVHFAVVDAVDPDQASWLAETVRRRRRRSVVPFPPLPARYFARLNEIPHSRYLVYRDRDGRLLAFLTVHDDGRDLHSGIWGYRSEADGGRRNLYFDVYPRQVELMLSLGRERLWLGAGMEQMKANLGGRPDPRWGVLGSGAAGGAADGRRSPRGRGPSAAPARRAPGTEGRSVLVRVARFVSDPRSRPGGRGTGRSDLVLECGQCGQWSSVSVTRRGVRTVRYWCRRCGAVGTGHRSAAGTVADFRARAVRPPDTGQSGPVGLDELMPAAMIRWVGSRYRRPPTVPRLTKPVIYQLYRGWDAHVRAGRDAHVQAGAPEASASDAGDGPPPVPGLPAFPAVVTTVNGAFYRTDLAVSLLSDLLPEQSEPARRALWERVEHARRWLAVNGRELCWIHQVGPGGGLAAPDPDPVATAAEALRAGKPLDPAACDTVRAALFGTERGPGFASLLAAYQADTIVAGLEDYLGSRARPLREETLARLAAPLAAGPVPG